VVATKGEEESDGVEIEGVGKIETQREERDGVGIEGVGGVGKIKRDKESIVDLR
jgi:hypothetical protein